MAPPDASTLRGMRVADLRLLCAQHNVPRKNGGRERSKEELIQAMMHHYTGRSFL